ncbi:unnamed protein product [Paramecium pentaurelia]|uniref:Myb-like domain-containing protein n=1 Tax=Paramecium pentaurelia TaxID=43138 RepID=A0A8S1TGI5_9CILI|nr:unnamed protein product [Paramecium pentaurelia]
MKSENSGSLHSEYLELNLNNSKQQDLSNSTHIKSGHWSEEEHQQYVQFLLRAKGSGDSQRKGQPLFKRMSQIIGTRTPSQCRSHHQKFNPFNPRLRRNHKIKKLPKIEKPILRSKQIMRKYFSQNKVHSEDEFQGD